MKTKKPQKSPIKKPRITEKGSVLVEKNIYIFDVDMSANKQEVAKAIFSAYKVKPLKVNILKVPYKSVVLKGKKELKGGGKKAVVYLRKGDKIEIA